MCIRLGYCSAILGALAWVVRPCGRLMCGVRWAVVSLCYGLVPCLKEARLGKPTAVLAMVPRAKILVRNSSCLTLGVFRLSRRFWCVSPLSKEEPLVDPLLDI